MGSLMKLLLGLSLMLLPLIEEAGAIVLLFGNDTTSFRSMDARFTPRIPDAGIPGEIYAFSPLNACSELNVNVTGSTVFAVVVRGNCTFETKIRHCQTAGFAATIVYNNEINDDLVAMSGNGAGIHIYGVFVSKDSGEKILGFEGPCVILPGFERKTWVVKWLVLSVGLIVLAIVGALVTTLCCIRQHILAEAESKGLDYTLNQKLLDEKILNSQFMPDSYGPDDLSAAALDAQYVVTDVDEGGASDSDNTSYMSITTASSTVFK